MKYFLPLMITISILSACGEGDDNPSEFENAKSISSFVISNIEGIIDEGAKTININLSNDVNLSSLSPIIDISEGASISPASGSVQDFTNPVNYIVNAKNGSTAEYEVSVFDECASATQIHEFNYDGKNYELITLNRNWQNAVKCAVERGGYLVEVNSASENNAIFNAATLTVNVDPNITVASDGGDAGYIWLGGTDGNIEGDWYWDGNNDGNGINFWKGDVSGVAINGLFTNWGNEPDDFSGQDGLGLAITQWPIIAGDLGNAKQWNDIKLSNKLYFIVEFD